MIVYQPLNAKEEQLMQQMTADVRECLLERLSMKDLAKMMQEMLAIDRSLAEDEYHLYGLIARKQGIAIHYHTPVLPNLFFDYLHLEQFIYQVIQSEFINQGFTFWDLKPFINLDSNISRGFVDTALTRLLYQHRLSTTDNQHYYLQQNDG